MTTKHEVRHLAESLRSMLINAHMSKGDEFGMALARRCAWEIGEIVSDISGRSIAAALLDDAAVSVHNALPMPDVPLLAPKALTVADVAAIAESTSIKNLSEFVDGLNSLGLGAVLSRKPWPVRAWRWFDGMVQRCWQAVVAVIIAPIFIAAVLWAMTHR